MIRKLFILVSLSASVASAQSTTAKRTYAPVCAKGVQIYTDIKDVPKPYDSLTVPAPPEPVSVTNEDEMEAAELAMRGRAGSIGATGVVVTDDRTDDGNGNVRIQRNLQGVYVPSDSARAQKACH